MAEIKREVELHWLESMYGVKPQSLPVDALTVASKLGPDGVKELIEQHRSSMFYRGGLIGPEERINLAESIHRLAPEGGGRWASGEPTIGDSPDVWIDEEVNELLGESR